MKKVFAACAVALVASQGSTPVPEKSTENNREEQHVHSHPGRGTGNGRRLTEEGGLSGLSDLVGFKGEGEGKGKGKGKGNFRSSSSRPRSCKFCVTVGREIERGALISVSFILRN